MKVTIQKTSKKLKAAGACVNLSILVCIISFLYTRNPSFLVLLLLSSIMYLVVKILIWWNHE